MAGRKKTSVKKKAAAKKAGAVSDASQQIDEKLAKLGDWRGERLAEIRKLMHEAVPDVVEEIKWMGTPVWSHAGIICTGETYKDKVKLTFAKGAALKDPAGLFNSSLEGNVRRAIDFYENDKISKTAFKALLREAAAFNEQQAKRKGSKA